MVSKITVSVELGPEAVGALMRPVAGLGGVQALLRTLQANVGAFGSLLLTPDLAERTARYVQSHGGGGFQGRLGKVLIELTAQARALEPMAA